jgi:hypothetical protein
MVSKSSKYVVDVKKLNTKIVQISGYTYNELKTGKRFRLATATPPERVNLHWKFFKLLYGRDLSKDSLYLKSPAKIYFSFVIFLKTFIERYENKKAGFDEVCKQVLWLGANELWYKKRINLYRWKEIASHYPKNHVVSRAYKYRIRPLVKGSAVKKKFIFDLKKYLTRISK